MSSKRKEQRPSPSSDEFLQKFSRHEEFDIHDTLRPSSPMFVYKLSFFAAIGGFLFGYDTGVISGAMILLKDRFKLNTVWQELIVAVTVGAAALFALIGAFTTDWFGRRLVIIAASLIFTIGAVVLAAAQDKIMLLIGRFIVGAGIGLASMTVPMYIAETAPMHLRGRLVTMNNLFITGGQFIAGLLCGGFAYVPDGWRFMLGLAGVPAMIQFIGFLFLPESPRWLVEHGRHKDALSVLLRLRSKPSEAEQELEAIKQAHEDAEREKEQRGGGGFILWIMLRTPHIRRALIVGCALQMFQQICGINTVMYYSATIIQMAGVGDRKMDIWLAAGTAGVNFFCTFIGLYLVERIGRRPLTLVSLFGVTTSLLALGVAFQLMADSSPKINMSGPRFDAACGKFSSCDSCIGDLSCGYCFVNNNTDSTYFGSCLSTQSSDDTTQSYYFPCNSTDLTRTTWAYGWCPSPYSWLAILGLVLYLFCFAPGMGPMPWTINSELYPQWARGMANGVSTATNWVFNLLISMTFLTLLQVLTKQGAYYLYTGISFTGLIFFFLVLPETRGKTLEDVEGLFAQPWCGTGSRFSRKDRKVDTRGEIEYVQIRGHNRYHDDSD